MTTSAEPEPSSASAPRACKTCGEPMAAGARKCPRCGGVEGAHHTCPYCRAEIDVVPSRALRFACNVCGRARVPLDDASITRSFAELPDLGHANRARLARGVWIALATTAAGLGAFSTLVLTLLVMVVRPTASSLTMGFAAITAGVPFVFAVMAALRARKNGRLLEESLDEAWLKVAAEYAKAHGPIDAKGLAKAMRIDDAAAELLLARLSVSDLLSGGHGAGSYGARVRVDGAAPPAALPSSSETTTLPATSTDLDEATAGGDVSIPSQGSADA